MRRIINVLIIVMIIMASGIFFESKATNFQDEQVEINLIPEQNKEQYRKKEINFAGIKIIYGDKILFSGENNDILDEQKSYNNIIIGVLGIIFLAYWTILLFKYEKENKVNHLKQDLDEMELLKKYNPLIAGCLVDNRQVLSRDVIAIILNLIQKQVINMEMIPNNKGKDKYSYIISENKQNVVNLDRIERFVLNYIFGVYDSDEVDLIQKLKELSKSKDFQKNLKQLNNIAQEELNKKGANINSVPLFIRKMNVFLIIFSIALTTVHIIENGLNIQIYQSTMILFLFVLMAVIVILPIIALIIHMILFIIALYKLYIKKTSDKYSGKHIISTSLIILITLLIIIVSVYFITPNKYICLDIFLIGMSILIIKTDNLMTKHNKELLNDYYSLNRIKDKIKQYSLIKEKQINYIKLWEEYLIYAVAFGIPIPIIDKLNQPYIKDTDIQYLLKCEGLYYVCKAYLEVMWEMNFRK